MAADIHLLKKYATAGLPVEAPEAPGPAATASNA
jgi:hypothetical protein